MKERLLIIDAKTSSILVMFLSTKKCTEILDLNDTDVAKILDPLKKYLV